MKPLILEAKDLNEYRVNETILYASDGTKELRLTFYGGIQVWKDGVKIYENNQPYPAVEFFNNLEK